MIVNDPKQGVVISSPMCVNLSVKEPVFAKLTNIRKAALSKEKDVDCQVKLTQFFI